MGQETGVAGCGRMGAPMLAALRANGIAATGFDIRQAHEFGPLAQALQTDPECFSQGLKTLFTVVRDIPQTEDVLFKNQSLIERSPQLERVVICSTLSPKYLRDLRMRVPEHIALIDAPMSGAAIAAKEARLSFMLGGTPADIAKIRPHLEAMGTHFHHMGPFGAGMAAKVLNNLLAASHTAMTRLVLDWADTAGLDETALLGLIQTSSGQNWLASGFNTIEFARDGFGADNSIGILAKDIDSALDDAPAGADISLPEAIREAIFGLVPRRIGGA